ncbi:acyl-CoA reductase-like NAD-dependent aldehyde dehydrogenase [Altererythrobacter atlanticus]|uniref:Succinate-semialdehyde dehydrogenase [NADP(+)] 2 n=1 Tax=Croceibacterium atlanticum TaxID=1267766 RepID=A0A0F7KW36_9SPHN|nr:aldehyde dehydrogenase family protein [Croceibacterium atlanticum]AKH43924.1 Putative succinate-semialdehyde dehydrogenase [NADP(+)] 2 [Croceibacterium atlanticum]MBB5733626.1 acyl-CoA reductase-like NAD-dependent aldehyde dehydrogenase [Croceibacterium atlanticum]
MMRAAPAQEAMLDVRNPRTGEADFRLHVSTAGQVAEKAARLRQNQQAWAAMPLEARCGVMARWLAEVKAKAAEIGEADAVDTGGCHTSYLQGFITLGNIGGWLEDAPKALARYDFHGRSAVMPDVEVRSQIVPYSLVGVISPWNAPLMLALLDAVPALFAGSAVLLKPSEVTPRVIETLFETVRAVPELAAVFDYVAGAGDIGEAVIGEADLICFTGSVPTGRKVAVACARRLIPCFLELGGKDPAIVTETADLDRAVTAVLRGAVYATGQVCYSTERVYVHEKVHDAFVEKLVAAAQQVRLNADDPRAGHIGPFTFAPQAEIVRNHLDDAVAKGARILTGGEVEEIGGGLYMRPTVLTGVNHDMLIMQDETFGPCIPVMAYKDTDQAIALANDTDFGLTASVIAGGEEEALAIGRRVNAGAVFLQDTFLTFGKMRTIGTHSFGFSGLGGSRTGPESILRFIRRKALMTQHGDVADIQDDHHLGQGQGQGR